MNLSGLRIKDTQTILRPFSLGYTERSQSGGYNNTLFRIAAETQRSHTYISMKHMCKTKRGHGNRRIPKIGHSELQSCPGESYIRV